MEDYYPTQSCQFAGFASPEYTLESWAWARARGDKTAMLQCLTPEEQNQLPREFAVISDEEFKAKADALVVKTKGYQIVKRELLSPDEVSLQVAEVTGAERGEAPKLVFRKYSAEWKMAKPIRD